MTLYPDLPQPQPERGEDVPTASVESLDDLVQAIRVRGEMTRFMNAMSGDTDRLPTQTVGEPRQSPISRWGLVETVGQQMQNSLQTMVGREHPTWTQEEIIRSLEQASFLEAAYTAYTQSVMQIGMQLPRFDVDIYERAKIDFPHIFIRKENQEENAQTDMIPTTLTIPVSELDQLPEFLGRVKDLRATSLSPGIRPSEKQSPITGREPGAVIHIMASSSNDHS